jgi:hypothetical protein
VGNAERVRQLKHVRETACGVGTRALKLRLNRLVRTCPVALAVRLALEIEDANLSAKRYKFSRYQERNYDRKGALIRDLIALFRLKSWVFGVHESDVRETRHVVYFEMPPDGGVQVSWHYTHEGAPLPVYAGEWDGRRNSTFPKLLALASRVLAGAVGSPARDELPAELFQNLLPAREKRERKAMPESTLKTNPLATSVAELATPKQLAFIRALGREKGINADEECRAVTRMDCRVEELSRRAASEFIDHLKGLEA